MSRGARAGRLSFAVLVALGAVDLGAVRLGGGGPVLDRGLAMMGAAALEAQVATGGTDQYWYAGRQLRRPLTVSLPGEGPETCTRRRVVFDAGEDGDVSPRVAQAAWDGSECRAEGWWALGNTIGIQHARATLEGAAEAQGVTFQATARQGARIFFGGAYTPREEGWVELVDESAGAPAGLREVEPTGYFRPIVGVDFALWPEWHRVRVAVGASAREIDRYFYFGISALQGLVFGPGQEGSAVDVHAGIQLTRRDVGVSGAACAPAAVCTRRDLRFSGVTFMVAIDGASAFRSLAGAVLR